MGLLSALIVSSVCAVSSATVSYNAVRHGKASANDLWGITLAVLGAAVILFLGLLFWFDVTGNNLRELLLPHLLDRRPRRAMLTAYALASAAIGTGLVALVACLFNRGGKA